MVPVLARVVLCAGEKRHLIPTVSHTLGWLRRCGCSWRHRWGNRRSGRHSFREYNGKIRVRNITKNTTYALARVCSAKRMLWAAVGQAEAQSLYEMMISTYKYELTKCKFIKVC